MLDQPVPVFTNLCCKLVGECYSIRLGRFFKLLRRINCIAEMASLG
jgi:hypothetical protein